MRPPILSQKIIDDALGRKPMSIATGPGEIEAALVRSISILHWRKRQAERIAMEEEETLP